MKKPEFDLCIIGGGSGGLVAAAGGATLGAKVALVEKHALGGDCLHYGCVPSKALLHSAKVAHTMRTANAAGIEAYSPAISIGTVMQRVASVIRTIEPNDSPQRFRGMGVDVIFGTGMFTDPCTFSVNDRALTAKNFVLATGSRPAIPPIEGLDTIPYLTNETVFSLNEDVPSLIVLGAGPIGLEMAQAFARLGSTVFVVQRGQQPLPKEDADITAAVVQQLRQEGVHFYTGHTPVRVEGAAGNLHLHLKTSDGTEKTLHATHLLVATGRRSNVENLGLEAAGVQLDKGRLLLDKRLRTTNKHIYACGDITDSYQFTHMAEHQAGVVLRNTLFHLPAKVAERGIPWCTFTDPEVARVGLSETEAKDRGVAHKVYSFPFKDMDRAITDADTAGFAKIITDLKGKLLGATLVGPHAGELIHEYVLALSKNMKAADLSNVIHIYPTLAQINRRVADVRRKQGLTPGTLKWIKRIFRLRGRDLPSTT
jgi:pyruvate/2-oxoglutarate dehydrogenase complex dihydrolipoamide dehydrogenase (E3) component